MRVSIAAVQLGFMLGGSVVIESYSPAGCRYLAWESITKNDFRWFRRRAVPGVIYIA